MKEHSSAIRTMIIAAAALLTAALPAFAQGYHYDRGYERQNGTYVAPHYETNPNNSRMDNWSTRGNTNPITGQAGTQNPNPGFNANGGSIYGGGSPNSDGASIYRGR